MAFHGTRGFADVIKGREMGRLACVIQVGPIPSASRVLIRGKEESGSQEGDVNGRLEWCQVRNQGLCAAPRSWERLRNALVSRTSRKNKPLILAGKTHVELLTSRTVR